MSNFLLLKIVATLSLGIIFSQINFVQTFEKKCERKLSYLKFKFRIIKFQRINIIRTLKDYCYE